jgi:PAS domain S-box-containing protein
MNKKPKILYLQYSPQFTGQLFDIISALNGEYECLTVHTREDFVFRLHEFKPDLVLSEEGVPAISGAGALHLVQQVSADIPFILLTTEPNEKSALRLLKAGASDYILLEKPQRLPFVLHNQFAKLRAIEKMQHALTEKTRLYEQNLAGVFNTNIDGRIRSCNRAFASILGYEFPEDLVGRDINSMYLSDKDREHTMQQLLDKGRVRNFETTLICQNGKHVQLLINSYLLYDPVLGEEVCEGVLIDYSDTAQILLNLDQSNAQLIKRNRNLEQFTYVISHNLRAPLSNIIGITELLKDEQSQLESDQLIDGLSKSIKTMDTIIKDISMTLQVKDRIKATKELVDFKDLMEEISASINNLMVEEHVQVHYDFEVPSILSIRGYIYSIFYNLTLNSIKYRRTEEAPVITLKSRTVDDEVQLIFEDNGKGIDLEKNGKKLFGLYQRFDAAVDGRGMGLFMVKTQVEDLQGSISLESELGKGTKIIISLPLT